MAIDLFDFYKRCLIPLTPHPAVTKILNYIMAGGETTDDYAEVLQLDLELQRWSRLTVQRMGRKAKELEQNVVMLGQDRVRNMILGRAIERAFVKSEDTLLHLAMSTPQSGAAAESAPKETADPKNKTPETSSEHNKEEATDPQQEEKTEDQEVIPDISQYKKYLTFANRSEKIAVAIRNSYPGQAFAGGVIFDYMLYFLKSRDLSAIQEEKLKNSEAFITNIFEDGARCAVAANAIIKLITIKHQKTVFTSALLHNIGKALLLAYNPKDFETSFMLSTGAKDAGAKIDSVSAELTQFDFDHAQAGALFFRRIRFFEDLEPSIDFHHHPSLLKFSSPAHYALSCVLVVSGALVKLFERRRKEDPNPLNILDDKLKASEEFKALKIKDDEWKAIKQEYGQKLMATQL